MSKSLSVIVPTFNEAPNIRPLVERVAAACKAAGITVDILIVDDESPGSAETLRTVEQLQKEDQPVRIHQRTRHAGRGLSSAVLLGFFMARYQVMLCMDGDLQHRPEDVPRVAAPVLNEEAEFTVGSRNVAGGRVEGWTLGRRIISAVATLLARPLTSCSDPMSGFFCLTQTTLDRGQGELNPMGFKIALELLVKCQVKKLKDVGISFSDRQAGESKLDMNTNLLYVRQLAHLYWYKYSVTIIVLMLVGVAVALFSVYRLFV